MEHWTLDDIHWEKLDRSKVDLDTLKVVKAASLVEFNARDYAAYLNHVFKDDPDFCETAWDWADEEVQHGQALAKWAKMVDPDFDFGRSFETFAAEIKIPVGAEESIRGSRVGEFVSRCLVECGTSSMYSAIAQGVDEPVLQQICKKIAADELRHYKLFYRYLKQYMDKERTSVWHRLRVAFGRAFETEDDELAFAYYAANHAHERPYERKRFSRAYAWRAYRFYRFGHMEWAIAMAFKAVGLRPHGPLNVSLARLTFWFMQRRVRRFSAAGV